VTALAIACWIAATPALPVQDPLVRRDVMVEQLLVEQRDTRVWYFTWGLGWVAATIAQFATWPITAPQDRPSLVAWGISSGLGAIATLALPPTALSVGKRLQAPGADVEKEWVEVHSDEVFNHSVWMHVGGVLLSAIPFFVLGAAYHRWDWPYLVLGLVVSEAQIATFPQLLRVFGVR
jgi:hypothetical protein